MTQSRSRVTLVVHILRSILIYKVMHSAKFLVTLSIIGFFILWHWRVSGSTSWYALAALTLFVLLCLVYGNIFSKLTMRYTGTSPSILFLFLAGFFVFNSLLFLLALVLPFRLETSILILSLGALLLATMYQTPEPSGVQPVNELPALISVLLIGLATTLWCSDVQTPRDTTGSKIVFNAWQDIFFHARQISAFANSHGASSIQNIMMSESKAPIYHFASYMSAAAISLVSGVTAIDIYSSFMLPLGIFLTGFAAYSLIESIWGSWSGLAAALGIVMLPDAYQLGFGNQYLSYFFLTQINLGMLYGMACIVMAWIFVIQGCRLSRVGSVSIGYVFLSLCLFYKAHIFVANAYLLLIYPCLFFDSVSWRKRLLIGLGFTTIFIAVVALSQLSDRVPVLRLDGSGIGPYIGQLLHDYDEGSLKTYFTNVFRFETHSKPVAALHAVAMLLISTLGIWLILTPLVLLIGLKRLPSALLAFPILIVGNYLLMTMGLALDSNGVGTVDELLNRPLVWAYFSVVVWTVGAAVFLLLPYVTPLNRGARVGVLALLMLMLAGPLTFSKNLQTFPARDGFGTYENFNAVPTCLVRASQFIRNSSRTEEIVQSSDNDSRFVVTALTERQQFAGISMFSKPSKALQVRLDELELFKGMTDTKDVLDYAASQHIDWYILHPGTVVSWSVDFLQRAQFECNGYRVFHLKTAAR